MRLLWNVVGIILCGTVGGVVGWAAMQLVGLQGTVAAILASIIGMGIATAAWLVLGLLVRSIGPPR